MEKKQIIPIKSSANRANKKRKEAGIKCSHQYLQEKFLKTIPGSTGSKDTLTLYLYNNCINKIENLNYFPNLTSLYLQNNQISRIENMHNLTKLKKLFIGHNNISVVEGLELLSSLEELYLEKQCLADGMALCFDPRTILAISNTLKVLNISNNNISSLASLSPLRNLKYIDSSHNVIEDIKDVCHTVGSWYYLNEATFTGNPFTKNHHYRENIIANAHCLDSLDGKFVSDTTRLFIRRFEAEKLKGSKEVINIPHITQGLPSNYSSSLQKAVSASVLRGSKYKLLEDMSTFDEKDAVYIPWQTLPKRRPYAKTIQHKNTASSEKKVVIVNSFSRISQ